MTIIEGDFKDAEKQVKGKYALNMRTVLDCGAGIGRVTIELLQNFFDTVRF